LIKNVDTAELTRAFSDCCRAVCSHQWSVTYRKFYARRLSDAGWRTGSRRDWKKCSSEDRTQLWCPLSELRVSVSIGAQFSKAVVTVTVFDFVLAKYEAVFAAWMASSLISGHAGEEAMVA